MSFLKEIQRRRTFGIISHPDAGKTTLTEKLLLFGGAIQEAGAVKNNKIKKGATSDFMEIERQRGISVATSVLAFNCTDYSTIKCVVDVAEELHKPVLCMLYPEHAADKYWTSPYVFAETVKSQLSEKMLLTADP